MSKTTGTRFGATMSIALGTEASKAMGFLQRHAGINRAKSSIIRWSLLTTAKLLRAELTCKEGDSIVLMVVPKGADPKALLIGLSFRP